MPWPLLSIAVKPAVLRTLRRCLLLPFFHSPTQFFHLPAVLLSARAAGPGSSGPLALLLALQPSMRGRGLHSLSLDLTHHVLQGPLVADDRPEPVAEVGPREVGWLSGRRLSEILLQASPQLVRIYA